MDVGLVNKLKIKSGITVILNAPEGYPARTGIIDEKLISGKIYDFIQLFVKNKSELNVLFPKILQAVDDNTILWISYPKKTSSIATDLSRDYGWDVVDDAGFERVSLVAVDNTWSALRFRRIKAVRPDKAPKATDIHEFYALLEKPDDGVDGTYVSIPFNVEKLFGTKGQVKVKATFDGYPYRGSLTNMGTGSHIIIVRKDIRNVIGKKAGDHVKVTIKKDEDERVINIPEDLKKAFQKKAKAQAFFTTLSYSNRKEYVVWITSAKKTETRERRLEETIRKLLKGLKNPSQK